MLWSWLCLGLDGTTDSLLLLTSHRLKGYNYHGVNSVFQFNPQLMSCIFRGEGVINTISNTCQVRSFIVSARLKGLLELFNKEPHPSL